MFPKDFLKEAMAETARTFPAWSVLAKTPATGKVHAWLPWFPFGVVLRPNDSHPNHSAASPLRIMALGECGYAVIVSDDGYTGGRVIHIDAAHWNAYAEDNPGFAAYPLPLAGSPL